MAPGSQAAVDVPAGRSGGKILKARRIAVRKTPYDRPISHQPQPQPPLLQPESPSWISGLVFPAKFVAGGASKILSSFWNPKSWSAPSSSSTDSDSESEDDSEDNENPPDRVIELNQQKGHLSQKSETLHLVEQLLMLEQYSREECDRLIEIINSRVVDYSMREGVDAGPSMTHGWTNNETPDSRSQAILEAKKWVAEKKFRSGSKSDLDNGLYALKSVTTPQPTEGEAGSPVDVAKSYMRARPPWASPINHNNSLSPSPLAADLFKEGTLYSSGGGISFSSAKRDYLSAGSWNIQDEIRRLRSKATEDMLSSNRSLKLASSMLEHDTLKHSLPNDKSLERDEPITLETLKSVDEIVNLAAEEGTVGLSDMRTTQIDLPTETLPTMPILEQYQTKGTDSIEMLDGQDAAANKSHDTEQNIRPSGEGNKIEKKEDGRQSDERNLDQESHGIDYVIADVVVDNNCYLMTESTEIPLVHNSQDSSNTNNDHTKAADGTTENRAVTRASRQSRRGKGRA
ncbi:protein KAKU4-like isoform X2 [Cynara cardunculus var. scolymus]|uniref:protein KAKU4-like isoform X2 n=1 Tax=Cynara cardunculus var. scolymus TaxID=59895 RepID=UPI000D6247D0|nr:protein KAKU4-like isoform X2 [Cynara cardunculus var. scolymus]